MSEMRSLWGAIVWLCYDNRGEEVWIPYFHIFAVTCMHLVFLMSVMCSCTVRWAESGMTSPFTRKLLMCWLNFSRRNRWVWPVTEQSPLWHYAYLLSLQLDESVPLHGIDKAIGHFEVCACMCACTFVCQWVFQVWDLDRGIVFLNECARFSQPWDCQLVTSFCMKIK